MQHINSTAVGGGVAEILTRLVPLLKEGLGLEARWDVIKGDQAIPLYAAGCRSQDSRQPHQGKCKVPSGSAMHPCHTLARCASAGFETILAYSSVVLSMPLPNMLPS